MPVAVRRAVCYCSFPQALFRTLVPTGLSGPCPLFCLLVFWMWAWTHSFSLGLSVYMKLWPKEMRCSYALSSTMCCGTSPPHTACNPCISKLLQRSRIHWWHKEKEEVRGKSYVSILWLYTNLTTIFNSEFIIFNYSLNVCVGGGFIHYTNIMSDSVKFLSLGDLYNILSWIFSELEMFVILTDFVNVSFFLKLLTRAEPRMQAANHITKAWGWRRATIQTVPHIPYT